MEIYIWKTVKAVSFLIAIFCMALSLWKGYSQHKIVKFTPEQKYKKDDMTLKLK